LLIGVHGQKFSEELRIFEHGTALTQWVAFACAYAVVGEQQSGERAGNREKKALYKELSNGPVVSGTDGEPRTLFRATRRVEEDSLHWRRRSTTPGRPEP
jgi:hypothetical protein